MSNKAARVLIAEDDRLLRTAAVTALRRAGFDVVVAEDGEQAVALAGAERPDLILLDLIMPKVDGFEALRRIKANPDTREVPVIVLSNLGMETDQHGAREGGAAGFFVKSALSLGDLVAAVRKVLSR